MNRFRAIFTLCLSVALLAAGLPSRAEEAPAIPRPTVRPVPASPARAANPPATSQKSPAAAATGSAVAPASAATPATAASGAAPTAAPSAVGPAAAGAAAPVPTIDPTAAAAVPATPAGPTPPAESAPPVPPAAEKAQSGRYLNSVLLGSATYRQTMLLLFRGKKNVPFWVRNMISYPDYVSGISERVEINGKSYELFSACSPKICAASNLRVLFTPDGKSGWLRTRDPATGEMFFGEPSPDQRLLLEKSGL